MSQWFIPLEVVGNQRNWVEFTPENKMRFFSAPKEEFFYSTNGDDPPVVSPRDYGFPHDMLDTIRRMRLPLPANLTIM